ncbi:MAG TPA: prepilin-type N-terminal cleavage/methylation domain-containing protein [Actinomycetes bacterium]
MAEVAEKETRHHEWGASMRPRETVPGQERTADEGFTLIELLVVIIIIGILAAIAIPVYLSQRDRAYDSAAKSDVRNLAQFEETLLAGTGTYGSFTDLAAGNLTVKPTRLVTLTITFNSAASYCLSAKHLNGSTTWYYDSQAGGIQPRGSSGCPVTTAGTSGGSLTG